MTPTLLPLGLCLALGACASGSEAPAQRAEARIECNQPRTGTMIARREDCVEVTDATREEARQRADAMREAQRRNNPAGGKTP